MRKRFSILKKIDFTGCLRKLYRLFFLLGVVGSPSVTMALDVPQIVWRDVQQGRLIGKGSFGDVYAGRWQGQEVAVKVLQIGTLSTEQIQREFEEEVRVMWTCQFPRVLRLYGVCTEPGHCAMVLERMERSLYHLIHSREEIPEQRRLQMAMDMAQGLVNLHGRGVLHRDLKSHNILLSNRGRAKISDFGLAKVRTTTSTLTGHRSVGTVRWRAPELLGLRPRFTAASDMYSYGMTLWELITRKTPFEDQPDDQIIIGAVSRGEREEIPPDCLPVWREIIAACWQQAPEHRPTAEAILARLMTLKPPERAVWLPEEEPHPSAIGSGGFAVCPASREDWQKVLRCYGHHGVPGYDVGKVDVIFNPSMNQRFAAQRRLLQQRQGNPRYTASWRQEGQAALRASIDKHLETLAAPYQDDDYPDVKLMPLWHGTQKDKLGSILSAGYGAFGDTDDGYFGRGIYATPEATYAQMYANQCGPVHREDGVLILNWGVTYSSYPIIRPDYDPVRKQLVHRIEHPKYDTHCIPVVPGTTPVDYVPITPPERHQYTEVVFFDSAQILLRYMITLQPTLPSRPNSQEGVMLEALREKEDKKRAAEEVARRRAAEQEEAIRCRAAEETEAKRIAEEEKVRQAAEAEEEGTRRRAAEEEAARRRAAEEPVQRHLRVMPVIARGGNERIYEQFVRGALIYRPTPESEEGSIVMPIAAFANPLEETFNLSRCGDVGNYLSISTGYRKGKKAENNNKVEVWIVPKFVINRDLATTATHFRGITRSWASDATIGLFWTWGDWDNLGWCDYLTSASPDVISSQNLYKNWNSSRHTQPRMYRLTTHKYAYFVFRL